MCSCRCRCVIGVIGVGGVVAVVVVVVVVVAAVVVVGVGEVAAGVVVVVVGGGGGGGRTASVVLVVVVAFFLSSAQIYCIPTWKICVYLPSHTSKAQFGIICHVLASQFHLLHIEGLPNNFLWLTESYQSMLTDMYTLQSREDQPGDQKTNPCTVFDVIQICQGLESVLELYWADRYPPFRPEPSEFLGPTRKAQQNRKERNCLRRTKECYQVCGAKLVRVLPSPIVIATDLGIVVPSFSAEVSKERSLRKIAMSPLLELNLQVGRVVKI